MSREEVLLCIVKGYNLHANQAQSERSVCTQYFTRIIQFTFFVLDTQQVGINRHESEEITYGHASLMAQCVHHGTDGWSVVIKHAY